MNEMFENMTTPAPSPAEDTRFSDSSFVTESEAANETERDVESSFITETLASAPEYHEKIEGDLWVDSEDIAIDKDVAGYQESAFSRTIDLLDSINETTYFDAEIPKKPIAAMLFDAFINPENTLPKKDYSNTFDVVGLPHQQLKDSLHQGDIIITRALAEGNLVDMAIVDSPKFDDVLQNTDSKHTTGENVTRFESSEETLLNRRLEVKNNQLILRPKIFNESESFFQDAWQDDSSEHEDTNYNFEPLTITVPTTTISRRGESAGEEAVEYEINNLQQHFNLYWNNFDRGLNSFETDMSFASDQDKESRYFDVALKEVGKALLDQAIGQSLNNFPVLKVIATTAKSVVKAWRDEAKRIRNARGERRIADYINDTRQTVGSTSGGFQIQFIQSINQARPAIFNAYRDAVRRSGISNQGNSGVLTGDAALYVRELRRYVNAFQRQIPSPAKFQQYFTEKFAGAEVWTRPISHGARLGGNLYLTVNLTTEVQDGIRAWQIDSVGSSWTLATVAPKADRLATSLAGSLKRQRKKVWNTNLPKMVELKIEIEEWGLNPTRRGFIRYYHDQSRYEVRSNYGKRLFRLAWAQPRLRSAVRRVDRLRGSNR